MKPLVRVQRDIVESLNYREALMAQPDDFFRKFADGRTLSLPEKAHYVEWMVARLISQRVYQNDVYRVEVETLPPFVHLAIHRWDEKPCDIWEDFQDIKNQLVGSEYEAIELFPAESRLVDTSNQYHLWVHVDPAFRFPTGFEDVADAGAHGLATLLN